MQCLKANGFNNAGLSFERVYCAEDVSACREVANKIHDEATASKPEQKKNIYFLTM